MKFYYTYILESRKSITRYYTGFTEDLESRLESHNSGKNPHTARYKSWRIKTAITINSDFAEAHNNLGNTFLKQGKLDQAVKNYNQALAIKPVYARAHIHLSESLKHQGKLDEDMQTLQRGLKKEPGNSLITDALAEILNYYASQVETQGLHTKAQKLLKCVTAKDTGLGMIPDEIVVTLFQECHSILASHELYAESAETQIWRGITSDPGCKRHMKIFNVIPEFCFGCYKVSIEPSMWSTSLN